MFSIRDVAKIRERKESVRKETFKIILTKFTNRIKERALQGVDEMFLDLPPIIMGYPPYDMVFATKYIARQLSRLGFFVTIPFPGRLYVSWKRIPKEARVPAPVPALLPSYDQPSDDDFKSLMIVKQTANKLKRKK